jgi:hypothetical protein
MYIIQEEFKGCKESPKKYKHYPIEKLVHGDCLCIVLSNSTENAVRVAVSRHKKKSKNVYKYDIVVDNSLIKVYCSKMT